MENKFKVYVYSKRAYMGSWSNGNTTWDMKMKQMKIKYLVIKIYPQVMCVCVQLENNKANLRDLIAVTDLVILLIQIIDFSVRTT